jgi:hypothetical protein
MSCGNHPQWVHDSGSCQLCSELRSGEKEISDAYLRVRGLVGAWDTKPGGTDRFEVTERKIKELIGLAARVRKLPNGPHIEAVNYATNYVAPSGRQPSPFEAAAIQQVAQHWLAGYYAGVHEDTHVYDATGQCEKCCMFRHEVERQQAWECPL